LDKAVAATGVACMTLGGVPGKLPPELDKPGADMASVGFAQFAQTQDSSWIPIYPMTVAMVRAMDTIEAVTKKEGTPISKFILVGYSKQGYAAWMKAAIDRRVVGIVPLASQTLNIGAQVKSPGSAFAGPQFAILSKMGVMQKMIELFDPYLYRANLKMPKLDVAGVQDHNYPTMAMSNYWDGLPGDKYALVMANVGHGVTPEQTVIRTTYVFIRTIAAGKKLPTVKGVFSESAGKLSLHVTSSAEPKLAQAWTAPGESADLRGAKWTSQSLMGPGGASVTQSKDGTYDFDVDVDRPAKGTEGLFAELQFEDQGVTYSLTTLVHVTGAK
jgi:PhoPQ-activated pathogenicity-related protein